MIFLFLSAKVSSHGRLISPPGRSTAWRFGFDTPINYNDNELFCGGFARQWNQVNQGKCGICGDPFDEAVKDHELPNGKYTKPIRLTGNYSLGEQITIKVDLTASHKGFFMFRICPDTSMNEEVTQDCLDQYVLKLMNENGSYQEKFPISDPTAKVYSIQALLPPKVTCSRCLLQWTYTAGNNWGQCPDGTSRVGCGPQETFRGCADMSISSQSKGHNNFEDDNQV